MLGPSCFSTAQERCAMPFISAAGMAAAFGISRSMMYFGMGALWSGFEFRSVGHCHDLTGVLAIDSRIPVRENAARILLPHPGVEAPELKDVVLDELLAEEFRRSSIATVERVRNDVFHRHQAQTSILFGLVQQELGLVDASSSVDELGIAVVEAHSAGAAWIGHARCDLRPPSGIPRDLELVEWRGDPAQRSEVFANRCVVPIVA